MVKRPKSPEIVEDARYFTVYQPYPLNPNWLDEDDQKACAMWIAECIGPNHLWAIHEKPKSRNMILLEVSKDFTDHGSLLGEHRWSDFLKKPTEDDKGRVTQVFHSFYARGRDAQKDGWKVVTVHSDWFNGWVPGRNLITHPYPSTHWCPTPVEDKTNKTLCRPLPVEQKPPPPRNQAPVVGSTTWVASQTQEPPTPTALATAWSNQANDSDRSRSASGASSPFVVRAELPPASPQVNVPVLPAAKGKPAWGQAVPLQKFVTGNERLNNGKKSAWSSPKPVGGKKSPFAEQPPKGPANAWVKPLKVPASHRHRPSALPAKDRTRTPSPWGRGDTNIDAWFTEDTFTNNNIVDEQVQVDTVAANSTSGSIKPDTPSSPRRGRANRRECKGDGPSPRRSNNNDTSGVDPISPQSEAKYQWDVPSAKSTRKKIPKPAAKKAPIEPEDYTSLDFGNEDDPKKKQEDKVDDLGIGATPVTDWAAEMDMYDHQPQSKGEVKKTNVEASATPTPASSGPKKKKAKRAAIDSQASAIKDGIKEEKQVDTGRNWGSWGVAAPTDKTKGKGKAILQNDFGAKGEFLGKAPRPGDPPKKEAKQEAKAATSAATDGVWGTWDVPSHAQSRKSKGKKKAAGQKANPSDQNSGVHADDEVVMPVPETNTVSGLDVGSDGDEYEHRVWDLPPIPYDRVVEDIDESEFHPWERNAAPDLNTWDPNAPLIIPVAPPKEVVKLKCPTHNYFCKKSICRDMAKLVREEELKKQRAEAGTRPRGGKKNGTRGRLKRGTSTSGTARGTSENENEEEERSPDGN